MDEIQAIEMFGALSQETRLRIVRFLVESGETGASAGEVGAKVNASSSRASFHLTALERAGVITSERRSRQVIYRANLETLGKLTSFLLNDCCGSHPRVLSCCQTKSS